MGFHLGLGSKAKRSYLSSPKKEKARNGENPIGGFDLKSNPNSGSKDEIFFDTKVCLDSDCEDDFFSVNGDSTPRGTTPNCQFTPVTPKPNYSLHLSTPLETKSETSPNDGKKRLFDLLQETFEGEHEDKNNQIAEKTERNELKLNDKKAEGSPYLSGINAVSSSEMTPNKDSINNKDRTRKAKTCCFSGLLSNCIFNSRRKMKRSDTF